MRASRLVTFLKAPSRRGDVLAVTVLVVVPVLLYALPAALGNTQLPGDDATQNFPLRVLAGREIASGHLPLFNAYVWSGAPLLGGWNAGALYPFTLLFAVVPATAAWVVNEVVVYVTAGIGLYWFLRRLELRPLGSLLGAASFCFAGAFELHLVHFGLVAGTSWIPFLLVAIHGLSGPPGRRGAWWGWTALLGVAGGMCILAGEPRAIDTTAIVVVLYGCWRLARQRARVGALAAGVLAGGVLTALIGAAQWLPGTLEVSHSQRAAHAYQLFASGSTPVRWLLTLLVPSLLGGSGSFGTSSWFTQYNLPEVVGYIGVLPVAAALAMLGRLRRGGGVPEWLVWHGMALVGILLALGGFTPLGRLLYHVPFFGGQRLQSRNIEVTDLALAVLLAYWVDGLVATKRQTMATGAERRVARRSAAMGLLALLAVAAVIEYAMADPMGMARFLGATFGQSGLSPADRPLFVVSAVLVAVAVAVVAAGNRGAPRRAAVLATAVVVVDLVAFNLTCLWVVAPGWGSSPVTAQAPAGDSGASPTPMRAMPDLGRGGRFVMYDPQGIVGGALRTAGQPDANVLDKRYAVQGYTAIVDGAYAQATGSHGALGFGTNMLDPAALSNGVADALDATVLVTAPSYLAVPSVPTPSAAPAASPPTGRRTVHSGGTARWGFGETLLTSAVTISSSARVAGAIGVRLALVRPDGSLAWQSPPAMSADGRQVVEHITPAMPAVGLVAAVDGGSSTFDAPVVDTAPGGRFTADGILQDVLGHWDFVGDEGTLAYFVNTRATPPLTLVPRQDADLAGASIRARTDPFLAPASAEVDSPHGATVVRAEAMVPGWTATWQPAGRTSSLRLSVLRRGIVQQVAVPPGRGTLTWHYVEPGSRAGVDLTVGGVVLAAAVAGVWLARRRRPQPGRRAAIVTK